MLLRKKKAANDDFNYRGILISKMFKCGEKYVSYS